MKSKFLKYEIQKFTIDYSKTAAKIRKQHKTNLVQKLKNLENNLTKIRNSLTIIKTNSSLFIITLPTV